MYVQPSRPITPAQAARVLSRAKRDKQRARFRTFHDQLADQIGHERIRWSA